MTTWREAFRNRRFVISLAISLVALGVLAFFMPYFFGEIITPKAAWPMQDVILDYLPPTNWSWTIFTLIYSTAVLTIATNLHRPQVFLVGLASYTGVTWLRMLSIYLLTLEPPKGIIPLIDPFLTLVVYPGGQAGFSKDLFFSGHVSSMAVFVFMEPRRWLKLLKVLATVAVGFLLMVQHVHYTLDVVAAPFFTYLVYAAIVRSQKASAILR